MAVTSLILGSGLSNIYGKFAVNPSDPENALIAYKQHQYNVGAIQVAFLAGVFYTGEQTPAFKVQALLTRILWA